MACCAALAAASAGATSATDATIRELHAHIDGGTATTSCRHTLDAAASGALVDAELEACFEVSAARATLEGETVLRAGETIRLGNGVRVGSGSTLRLIVDPSLAGPPRLQPRVTRSPKPTSSPSATASALPTTLALLLRAFRPPVQLTAQSLLAQTRYEPGDSPHWYPYFDEPVPLSLAPDELGIQLESGLRFGAARSAIENEVLTRLPGWRRSRAIGPWTLFSTQEASGTALLAAVEPSPAALDRIRPVPGIAFLAPIFRLPRDGATWMMPKSELVVRVAEGVDDATARSRLADAGARLLQHPYGSNPRDYLVQTGDRDGFRAPAGC